LFIKVQTINELAKKLGLACKMLLGFSSLETTFYLRRSYKLRRAGKPPERILEAAGELTNIHNSKRICIFA